MSTKKILVHGDINHRRQALRKSCFLRSVCQDAETIVACDILNLSSNGARLCFPERVMLPQSFKLHLQLRGRKMIMVEATPVWSRVGAQGDCLVGVTFLGSESDTEEIENFTLATAG